MTAYDRQTHALIKTWIGRVARRDKKWTLADGEKAK